MNVIIGVIGLCCIGNGVAKEYIFEFDLGGRDNDNSEAYSEDGEELNSINDMGLVRESLEERNDKKNIKAQNKEIDKQAAGINVESKQNDKHNHGKITNTKKKKLSRQKKSEKSIRKEDGTRKIRELDGVKKKNNTYLGENFPKKYLELDLSQITIESLRLYINSLNRTLSFFSQYLNETDVNVGLGLYMSLAILKHSIKRYGEKTSKELTDDVKYLIKTGDNILSHYLSVQLHGQSRGPEYKVAQFFRDDSVITVSLNIERLEKGKFTKWIFTDGSNMHGYVREMDEATLPKEIYVTLSETMNLYFVNIEESDECISRLSSLPYPVPIAGPMRRCSPDPYCEEKLHSSPSVAYALSHRFLNIMFRRMHRRCYIHSEEFDEQHLQMLCTFMYREAVYIARRGFFARDLFMEHIALCGFLGYEEFYRPSWFRKAASWVDDQGCTMEFRNFDYNRTKPIAGTDNPTRVRFVRASLEKTCHHHLMALILVVLSMGIRYTLHRFT